MWCRLNNEAPGDHANLFPHLFIPPSLHPSSPPPPFPSILAVSSARFCDGFSNTGRGCMWKAAKHSPCILPSSHTHTQTHLSRRLCSLGQLTLAAPPPLHLGCSPPLPAPCVEAQVELGGGGGFPGLATLQSTHTSWVPCCCVESLLGLR